LLVSGQLDRRLYGPGVMPHLTPFMAGRGRPSASGPLDGSGRRSLYLAVRRNFLSPLFLAFDYPIPFTSIGHRSVSNVPAQALALMNNPFIQEEAGRWAAALLAQRQTTDKERVQRMYVAALGRAPTKTELEEALSFVKDGTG